MEKSHVNEKELRHPAFRHIDDLSVLERNDFGQIIRKDRYQSALSNLSVQLYGTSRNVWFAQTLKDDLAAVLSHVGEFEFFGYDLSEKLKALEDEMNFGKSEDEDSMLDVWPALKQSGMLQVELMLRDGSLLRNVTMSLVSNAGEAEKPPVWEVNFTWRGMMVNDGVFALREQKASFPLLTMVVDKEELASQSTMEKSVFLKENQIALESNPAGLAGPESALRYPKS